MKLGEVKVGDKFYFLKNDGTSDRMYLRIDMNPSEMFLTMSFPKLVCGLDLTTYKVMCFNTEYEVEVEHDNVYI